MRNPLIVILSPGFIFSDESEDVFVRAAGAVTVSLNTLLTILPEESLTLVLI